MLPGRDRRKARGKERESERECLCKMSCLIIKIGVERKMCMAIGPAKKKGRFLANARFRFV